MQCPKCKHVRLPDQVMCSACGIYFAKWEARERERAATAALQDDALHDAARRRRDVEQWTRRWLGRVAGALLLGSALPLLKHSLVLGQSVLAWPWQLAGLGDTAATAMARATVSDGPHAGAWVALPLVVASGCLLARWLLSKAALTASSLVLGLGGLVGLLVVFYREAEQFGLYVTPPSTGGGWFFLVAMAAGALVVGANHASTVNGDRGAAGRWAGAAGLVLVAQTLLFALGADQRWRTWPLLLLYVLLLLFGALAAVRLAGGAPAAASIRRLSLLARVVLGWSWLAVIISQGVQADPYTAIVIQAGGGVGATTLAAIKALLLYGGCGALLALALARWLVCEPPVRRLA